CRREDVQNQNISVSSRSSCQVIDLANHLVQWARASHPQPECRTALEDQSILPVREDDPCPNPRVEGYTLAVKQFKDRDTEIAEVAKLAHLQAHKRPENTLAILVPTRAVQQAVAQKLDELGASYSEVGKVSEEQVRTILDIKLAVDFLAQPHQPEALYRVLSQVLLKDLEPEALESVAGLIKRFGVEQVLYPVGDSLPWLELPDQLWDREVYARFSGTITRLKHWLSASTELPPEDLVLFLAEDLQLQGEQLEIANNLCLQIRQRVTENPAWKLIDIARDLPRLTESLKQFARVIYEQKGFEPQPGVITLLTAHKSKGLEWDTVYLTGVTAAEFPSLVTEDFRSDKWYLKKDMSNPLALFKAQLRQLQGRELVADPLENAKHAEISERLRLLYVAITRARKNLLICRHAYRFNKKVNPSLALQALEKYIREEGEKYANRLP
ncbi:MAG TPA: 3'-5' exonuclease, partial [Verrucomicrobiae bacterium]|nr:3'-5' exonuclease [Verrucomicrobiae bacterium]